jgi:ABC-type antimicrobial peptide transport system permease subunit
MQDRLCDSLARQRFASTMLSAFAAFAGCVRCSAGDIIGVVLRQEMELSVVGILAGLAGAAAVTRVMASLLFGVSAIDAATFVAVPGILAAVAFAATAIPALRATRVDPMVALREE